MPSAEKKKSGEAADREESEEAEGVEHGRIVVDGALVESGRPIENFDGGRQCDSIAQRTKIREPSRRKFPATNM